MCSVSRWAPHHEDLNFFFTNAEWRAAHGGGVILYDTYMIPSVAAVIHHAIDDVRYRTLYARLGRGADITLPYHNTTSTSD